MAILNPDHLLEQAARLIVPPRSGPPRQVDLRRAISSAYYAVFHAISAAMADEFVGVTKRAAKLYALAYRGVDHRALRDLCNAAKNPQLPPKYRSYAPATGFEPDIQVFASLFKDLQERRHEADYDPSDRINTSDAMLAITTARNAITRFRRASELQRVAFLTLLAFPPR